MRLKNFNWIKKVVLIPVAAALLASCGPLDGQQAPRSEYRALCNAIAQGGGGKITKEQFLAAAKDKEQAEKTFRMCDVNNKGYITEEDVESTQKMRMLREAIRAGEVGVR